jgi:hypothetical protein
MNGDAILGLVSGKNFEDESWYNRTNRRRIFRDYPTGHFPLTGFLSLMETEACDSYKFGWFEKRMPNPYTLITGGAAPFSPTGSDTASASPLSFVAGTVYRVKVDDADQFLVNQVIYINDLPLSSGLGSLTGVVTTIVSSTKLEFRVLEALAAVLNTSNNIDSGTAGPGKARITVIGNAQAEGDKSGTGRFYPPIDAENFTQIFRNPFEFTATSLKIPTEFEETGAYSEAAEDALRDHMVEMEMAFLFGTKSTQVVTGIDGRSRPKRTTGGLLWYLKQWEAADSIYRGGSGAPAATLNTDEEKRIIRPTGGEMTISEFDSYIERAFRVTNTKTFEKLVMCGNGFLGAVNRYLKNTATLNKDYGVQKVYGNDVTTWISPWGTLHFKSHPLFNLRPDLRKDGFIIDVNRIRFRPLNDRDTTLLENRQDNDTDGRKDEWLTEAGLEVNMPEAHMYFKGVTDIVADA